MNTMKNKPKKIFSAQNIFLLVLFVLVLGFVLYQQQYASPGKKAFYSTTKPLSSCEKGEWVVFDEKNLSETIKGTLIDIERDNSESLPQRIKIFAAETEKLKPFMNRLVEARGDFLDAGENEYYADTSGVSAIRCTNEDLATPQDLHQWMDFIAQNINSLNLDIKKKEGGDWKIDSFYLISGASDRLYFEYTDKELKPDPEDRAALIKIGSFSKKEIGLVADMKIGDNGEYIEETGTDSFKSYPKIQEYRQDNNNNWVEIGKL